MARPIPPHLLAKLDQCIASNNRALDDMVATVREITGDPDIPPDLVPFLVEFSLHDHDNHYGVCAMLGAALIRLAQLNPGGGV